MDRGCLVVGLVLHTVTGVSFMEMCHFDLEHPPINYVWMKCNSMILILRVNQGDQKLGSQDSKVTYIEAKWRSASGCVGVVIDFGLGLISIKRSPRPGRWLHRRCQLLSSINLSRRENYELAPACNPKIFVYLYSLIGPPQGRDERSFHWRFCRGK